MSWFGVAIRRGLSQVWKHRWLFGVPIATLLLGATIYAVRMPDVYTASATIEIRDIALGDDVDLPTERRRLSQTADTVRDRIISQRPVSAIVDILMPESGLPRPEAIEAARKHIEYDRITDYSFKISISDEYPERARRAAEALVGAFFEQEREVPLAREERDHAFYEVRYEQAQQDVSEARAALDVFRAGHKDTLPDEKEAIQNLLTTCRTDLTSERQQETMAARDVTELTRQIAALENEIVNTPVRPSTPEERALERQLSQASERARAARAAFNVVKQKYQPRYDPYIRAKAELDAAVADETALQIQLDDLRAREDQRLVDRADQRVEGRRNALETSLREARSRKAAVHARVEELSKSVATAQAQLAQIDDTQHLMRPLATAVEEAEARAEHTRKLMEEHLKLARYYRDSPASEVTHFRVAQPPVTPIEPSGPFRVRILASAVLLGGLIGYLLLLVRRRFAIGEVVTRADFAALVPGAIVVGVPLLEDGRSGRFRVDVGEVLLGVWVLGCVVLSTLAFLAFKGALAAPAWLLGLLGPVGGA